MSHLTETFTHNSTYLIKWTRLGSPENTPLILCHGTPFSSVVWLPFARALQQRYCVYLWDLAGYGDSQGFVDPGDQDKSKEPDVGFKVQGEILAALYAHWGFSPDKPPHVVAHDIGGATVLQGQLFQGLEYASLCLLNIVMMRPWGSPFLRLVREQGAVFEQIAPHVFDGMIRSYVQSASWKGLRKEIEDTFTEPWAGRDIQGRKAFVRQIACQREVETVEMENLLEKLMPIKANEIEKRIKVIWGVEDTWIPIDRGDRLSDAVKAREYVKIPEAGHLVMIDQPERVMFEIATWLAQFSS